MAAQLHRLKSMHQTEQLTWQFMRASAHDSATAAGEGHIPEGSPLAGSWQNQAGAYGRLHTTEHPTSSSASPGDRHAEPGITACSTQHAETDQEQASASRHAGAANFQQTQAQHQASTSNTCKHGKRGRAGFWEGSHRTPAQIPARCRWMEVARWGGVSG